MTRVFGHGLSELRAQPWRAVLSAISLCIGVLAVVAITTLGQITAEVFVAVAEQQDGRAITARGALALPTSTPARLRSGLDAATGLLTAGGGAVLLAQPSAVTGLANPATAMPGSPMESQPVTLVAGDLRQIRRLPLLEGRWLAGRADVPVEIVLNEAAAARWGRIATPLLLQAAPDQGPVSATVVGIVADGTGDLNVWVGLPALLHARPAALEGTHTHVLIHHPTADLATLSQIANRMAEAAGGHLVDGKVQRIDNVEDLIARLHDQQVAFSVVAAIALAIAALGILNIGLASIGERSRELVIRRAVGATRADILGQILVASVIVGLFAAGVATLIAVVGVEWWAPRQISPAAAFDAPGVPWHAVLLGVLASAGTTLLGSSLPAVVAARLDVALSLRD